jgi:hypothetical protein
LRAARRIAALATALAPLACAIATAASASDGHTLTGLRLYGASLWRSTNPFFVEWDPNPSLLTSSVHLQLFRSDGAMVGQATDEGLWSSGINVRVPEESGVYLLTAWDVDTATSAAGPVTWLPLHFDNTPPTSPAVNTPTWVAPGDSIPVHITHPPEPLPLSGIAGYAVSIDHGPNGSPCAQADRCVADEIDLPGGIDDDTTALTAAAEGVAYVHAAAVSGTGMRSATASREVEIDGTPPEVVLAGLPAGWADGPVRLTAAATDPLSGMAPGGPGGPLTAIAVDGAPATLTPGPKATAVVAGQGTHQVAYWARDAVGNAGDGSLPFSPAGRASIRIDETDPAVRFVAPDPDDPERIEAAVADSLSGPDPGRGGIALRRVGSSGPFQSLPTDWERGRLVARWNSDDFAHGAYEFRATGFDAAGNSTTSQAGIGGPLVLTDPVKREARVAFGFGGAALVYQRCARSDGSRHCRRAVVRSFAHRPTSRTVPCCHASVVGGRLVDPAGKPLAGQTVEVVERLAGGADAAERRTPAVTDARGYFRARLAPGPSRTLSAEFAGTRHLTRAAASSLRLRVRAGVQLRASTAKARVGGTPVVFSGRIVHPEARIPVRGLPVELEFRLPGLPWTQFRTVQSDAAGRFTYPYSFSDDDSAGVRFQFRAFVAASGNWPFAPATSRPLAVTG